MSAYSHNLKDHLKYQDIPPYTLVNMIIIQKYIFVIGEYTFIQFIKASDIYTSRKRLCEEFCQTCHFKWRF